ncbi:MAG TPA: amidohydrolase family protein [Mycobacterium sp.]|nr:amidohydrolase family protein [Mycobacterium sp.]
MASTDDLVDVHAHFTTPHYVEVAKAAGHVMPAGMPETYWPQWTARHHLDLMDEAGIGRAVLSLSSPGVYFGDERAARSLAREVNEFCADAVRQYPRRFGQFATLPLPDVDGSLAELAYCFDQLGVDGVVLLSNHAGIRPGDKRFHPVLAELDRRGAVVLLHPTICAGHEELSCARPQPMIEFLFDAARAVTDFILTRAAQRFGHIRLIVPQLGGVLPLLAERIELFRTIDGEPADRTTVAATLGRFYYDLTGTPTKSQIAGLTSMAKPDRLLYGSDYAWTRPEDVLRLLTALDVAFDGCNAGWRSRTTHNANALLARGR